MWLDWFWRGWFYSTDHVDIALDEVKWYQIDTQNPDVEAAFDQGGREPADIALIRDEEFITSYIEADPTLNDFYTTTDPFMVLGGQSGIRGAPRLSVRRRESTARQWQNYYGITFRNEGGLVMPLILQFEYEDGTQEIRRIPAEIWKMVSRP